MAGTTFIFSTHDQKVIDMADRLIRIEDGEIRRLGVKTDKEWIYADNPDKERVGTRSRQFHSIARKRPSMPCSSCAEKKYG